MSLEIFESYAQTLIGDGIKTMHYVLQSKYIFFLLIVAGVLIFSAEFARAQLFPPDSFDMAQVIIEPMFPGPHQTVEITIESFSIDLDRETVSWFVNGSAHSQGIGLTSLEITTGSLGTETTIRIIVGQNRIERSLILRPAQGTILWEADSYTPPHYRGRALLTPGTSLRMHANAHFIRPNGSSVPEENILYTWRINGQVVADVSGRGKASVILPASSFPQENRVSVRMTSDDNTYTTETFTRIPSVTPHLVLYYEHPLTGLVSHKALSTTDTLFDSEATIVAIPYFMDAETWKDEDLLYTWTINNSVVSVDPFDPNRITFGLEDAQAGEADIILRVEHTQHVLQSTERRWRLILSRELPTSTQDPFMRRVELGN